MPPSVLTPYVPPAWVSAPFSALDEATIDWNVKRAEFIGRLAALSGFAPIVVHSQIRGVFAPGPLDDDDDEVARARGLRCDLSIVKLVASHSGGAFFELLPDNWIRTSGMRAEWLEWLKCRGGVATSLYSGMWGQWRNRAVSLGLGQEWKALQPPPGAST